MAPWMKRKKKVGLALGGGGARGLAHIGVLQVLQEHRVPIDMIAGVSVGALIGALYAQSKDADVIEDVALQLDRKKLFSLVDLTLPRTGFIKGGKVRNLLRQIMGSDLAFSDLKIPLACVATDINVCGEVVIDQGSVLEALRASISIPAIFTVVKWKGRYLVDGGLVNPVPVSVAKRMGADFIIAVNVIPDVAERVHRADRERTERAKEPNIFNIIMQSIYIGTYSLVKSSMEEADIIIEPNVGHIGSGDFHHAQECILQGEMAAQASVPEIKKKLKIA